MNTKLAGVSPVLIAHSERIIAAMAALGYEMRVTDGLRTAAQQAVLYAQGRTAPGAVVTQCDGVLKKSNHQAHDADGMGHAVDMTFYHEGKPSWDLALPWALYGLMATTLGCAWGGNWHTPDRPHIEY